MKKHLHLKTQLNANATNGNNRKHNLIKTVNAKRIEMTGL